MLIREYNWQEDYDGLIALWQALNMYKVDIDGQEQLRWVAERNPGLFLVAVAPERGVVGSVIGAFDGRRAYLYHVAVQPDYRRHGYGRALLLEVERRFVELGAPKIRFMVMAENQGAPAFSESLGYRPDSMSVSMSKTLTRPESAN